MLRLIRDVFAWLVVLLFVFPLFWWVLASFKPYTAIFNQTPIYTDFTPTTDNYAITILGQSRINLEGGIGGQTGGASSYYSIPSIVDSMIVAVGSTMLAVFLATLAAYGLSRFAFKAKNHFVFLRSRPAHDAADRRRDPAVLHLSRYRPARHPSRP